MASGDATKTTSRRKFLEGAAAGAVGVAVGEYFLPMELRARSFPLGTQVSFGQCGEDLIVRDLLTGMGVSPVTYVDIGAYMPVLGSNTYMFYRAGGRGVLVEPNVSLIPELRRRRPRDTVLNVGIGFSGEHPGADYYVLNFPQLNTFDRNEAERRVRDSEGVLIEQVTQVPLVDLNRVLVEHFVGRSPDFLSIDTEGLDLAILTSLDFTKHRPKVICAETLGREGLKMDPGVTNLLTGHGYAVRGMTIANTIFVDTRSTTLF